jgi:selenocysteine-specific elongation factor
MRIVATAGHVDHGKSSLVQALTGTDPDRFEEEQRRGLTIDLGFAHMVLPNGEGLSFIDVPGHVRFLRNMLAGVGGVDACLFVVAATEGWKPQSEEHLRILQLLGLRHGLVVMTMSDLVDDEWLQLQHLEVRDRLAGTFLAEAPIVSFSSRTGDGLEALLAALEELVRNAPTADDVQRPRLWIDRVFAAKGAGTVVTGTLTGGALEVEQRITVVPLGNEVRVRGIQSHNARAMRLQPGTRAALNLTGVDHDALARGDSLVIAEQWRPTRCIDASLHVLAALDHDVSRRGAFLAYIGSGELPVRLRVLGSQAIPPGGDGTVRMYLAHPLALTPGDRYVLRESGRSETVGGGEVLDVAPVLPASKARPDRSVDRVIAERGWIDVDDLAAITGERRIPTVGRWAVSPAAHASMTDDLNGRLDRAGVLGLDMAALGEEERALLAAAPDVAVAGGHARRAAADDPVADHPFIVALLQGGTTPPDPGLIDRGLLREMARRKLVVERDGMWFHPETIAAVGRRAAALLDADPAGFSMSQFREAMGTSRKYAVPLANELDARGLTRRLGDLRVAGPRLSRT